MRYLVEICWEYSIQQQFQLFINYLQFKKCRGNFRILFRFYQFKSNFVDTLTLKF